MPLSAFRKLIQPVDIVPFMSSTRAYGELALARCPYKSWIMLRSGRRAANVAICKTESPADQVSFAGLREG
jgi:hypothetical protein